MIIYAFLKTAQIQIENVRQFTNLPNYIPIGIDGTKYKLYMFTDSELYNFKFLTISEQ